MVLLGTVVNTAAIIVGALLGSSLSGIKENMRVTVMQGISLAIFVLGIQMGMASQNFLLVIFSLVIGSILGEWWKIEEKLQSLGIWLENRVGGKGKGSISTAFVTATLVYCIGAMAILGSLDSGLRNDHQVLFTKAMLDGFAAIIFASALGIGVIFSAVPVFLYQGLIALSASYINQFVDEKLMMLIVNEITATGGIMIMAISINLLELKKIRIANMLPALLVVSAGVPIMHYWSRIWEWIESLL
ncbi:DUF554 domain-containing protein [Aneurinibacillus aneurinilyticus]|jgi:uncharacterized membrane protein YqgA involved in biofilm formation|uniref:DUF554 domain-containing protein n=2 Tax=Aneurinibacillus aneurinilyticus TaxID=1391 RepID=A0A848CZ25_ANEAE|nr:DUF554 domain-containing protein [Aneurinibacillus aneurinilyticus]ERI04862.1 hypothetical protein HMPREF0083_05940 [Aneurinibacillus aneurinilyticus ATCC 12856]MCI1693428.1 DUF554 domain-containing protein [Aneurinibacillus aneurinilyticus]MED0706005.1 DUF554 domain-containing protein [Aneurinibacillus aneurinilyticus]MED0721656.1 DUF554 domain-containing protein [Aneurinibacillus aneurinilyticus]MED0730925.1 DUF554 domain-containing protein [Aneurinibacillus aneurinilyticus]